MTDEVIEAAAKMRQAYNAAKVARSDYVNHKIDLRELEPIESRVGFRGLILLRAVEAAIGAGRGVGSDEEESE